MLTYLRKHNPKEFFKLKSNHVNCNLTLDDFSTHFKNLSSATANNFYDDCLMTEAVYDELDFDISMEEIRTAIRKLKTDKSCGEDCIVNEIFKNYEDLLMPYLHKLFNKIFHCGFYPESWSTSFITQFLKKET